ncbi:hypothetical protein Z946_3226 [Sulfitobacter noctilucicola]|nr:hypothetical protein Z946_3226 [Sulfitobacter noctilucicola]
MLSGQETRIAITSPPVSRTFLKQIKLLGRKTSKITHGLVIGQ